MFFQPPIIFSTPAPHFIFNTIQFCIQPIQCNPHSVLIFPQLTIIVILIKHFTLVFFSQHIFTSAGSNCDFDKIFYIGFSLTTHLASCSCGGFRRNGRHTNRQINSKRFTLIPYLKLDVHRCPTRSIFQWLLIFIKNRSIEFNKRTFLPLFFYWWSGRQEGNQSAGSTTICSLPGSLIISMATTREEVAPVQGFHHPEENPGGVILLSTEGLGAKWRKE